MGNSIDYAIAHQSSALIAASITATTAATAVTLLTTSKQRRLLSLTSSLNNPVMVTCGGVDFQYLSAGGAAVFDFGADGEYFPVGVVIGAYYTASAPSSGSLYATSI